MLIEYELFYGNEVSKGIVDTAALHLKMDTYRSINSESRVYIKNYRLLLDSDANVLYETTVQKDFERVFEAFRNAIYQETCETQVIDAIGFVKILYIGDFAR